MAVKKPAKKSPSKSKPSLEPEILPSEEREVKRTRASAPRESEAIEAEWVEDEDAGENDDEIDPEIDSEDPGTAVAVSLPESPESVTLESELRAVSATDPLRRFLEEVRRIPLLAPEEELELALKLQQTGDVEAAKRLVQANLRLVVKIAFEYRSVYANSMDLIQEGNLGLMKAVSKYEPQKGARLGYYASWWIRSYILKYLLDNFRMVRIGTTQAQKKLFFHLVREKERLEAQGAIASPKLLADRLNVKEKEVIEMEQRLLGNGGEVSIDTPTHPDGGKSTLQDILPDERVSAADAFEKQQWLEILEGKLPEFEQTLNEKERKLLKERLLSEDPKTLQEVADLYGLTRERARQIEAKVLEKLKEFLRDELKPV